MLAHSLTSPNGQLVAMHNFADDARRVTIDLPGTPDVTHVVDLLGNEPIVHAEGPLEVNLPGYGYRWLRIVRAGEKRIL